MPSYPQTKLEVYNALFWLRLKIRKTDRKYRRHIIWGSKVISNYFSLRNNIPDNKISYLKTELRKICEKIWNLIQALGKNWNRTKTLSRYENMMVIRKNKNRSIAAIDRTKCTEKCLNSPEIASFNQLDYVPTKRLSVNLRRFYTKSKIICWNKNILNCIQQRYHLAHFVTQSNYPSD